jgi:transcriptional regulator with XRE-family HTH domain
LTLLRTVVRYTAAAMQHSNGDRKSQRKRVGQVMKTGRKRRGYTQEEVADRLRVSLSTYGKYERGDSSPTLDMVPVLVEMLGIRPVAFVEAPDLPSYDHLVEEWSDEVRGEGLGSDDEGAAG